MAGLQTVSCILWGYFVAAVQALKGRCPCEALPASLRALKILWHNSCLGSVSFNLGQSERPFCRQGIIWKRKREELLPSLFFL